MLIAHYSQIILKQNKPAIVNTVNLHRTNDGDRKPGSPPFFVSGIQKWQGVYRLAANHECGFMTEEEAHQALTLLGLKKA